MAALRHKVVNKMVLSVPGLPPSLNDWANWHWAKQRRIKKEWKEKVALYSLGQGYFKGPVEVKFIYFIRSSKTKDLDNFMGPKFILDGLKGSVILDDNFRCVPRIIQEYRIDEKDPHVEIHIRSIVDGEATS